MRYIFSKSSFHQLKGSLISLIAIDKKVNMSLSTAGFLKPGKIVIYLDMYGQMIEDKHDQGFTLSNVDCSNFFPKIPDYQDNFDLLLKAMKYVIVALTHWTDLPVNNVDRSVAVH